jgi:hypothetical protein
MATLDYDKIINGIRKALYGYEVREYLAQSMEWTKAFVTQSVEQIKGYLRQAEAARDAAKASQDAAKVSETNAKASENAAASSASAAAGSASAAKTSENAAKTSETNAKTSETNAKASENETRQLVEAAKKVVNTDKTLTIDGAPADAKTVGDKFKNIKTDWNSVTDKPSTFPPSAHNHSKLTFEHQNEVNFVGTPGNNTVYWGYRDNTIDEYQFNDGRGSGAFANVRANKFIGSLEGNANTATKATGVTDYNNSGRLIQVGWAGDGLNTSNLTHIAGYTDNGTKIKDVSKDVLKSWLGLDSAASGVQSSGSNYIRFGDGTQICWGTISNVTVTVTGTVEYELYLQTQHETISRNFSAARITFPQAFSNTSYSVVFQNSYNVTDANTYIGSTFDFYSNKYDMNITGGKLVSISSTNPAMGKATTGCTLNSGGGSMYVAVGRWK